MDPELNKNTPSAPEPQEPQESQEPQEHTKRSKKGLIGGLLAIQQVFKWIFEHPGILPILFPVAALIFVITAPTFGSPAGVAVGSWEGITEGVAEGAEAGIIDGLSAEDTTARIVTKLSQTGKLQVLLLDLKLSDIYEEGAGPQYAALLRLRGEGVFTVDLAQSHVAESSVPGVVTIEIPHPEFTSYLDNSAIDTVAEYKAPLFNGSTKNGYKGWLNTMNQLDQRIQSELLAYDTLVERAEASAKKQVELLAQSICGDASAVEVRFIEEAE